MLDNVIFKTWFNRILIKKKIWFSTLLMSQLTFCGFKRLGKGSLLLGKWEWGLLLGQPTIEFVG